MQFFLVFLTARQVHQNRNFPPRFLGQEAMSQEWQESDPKALFKNHKNNIIVPAP